ncbi:MAG: hypothetical protein V7607_6334 [Solirubrobacteraceae bacterium]
MSDAVIGLVGVVVGAVVTGGVTAVGSWRARRRAARAALRLIHGDLMVALLLMERATNSDRWWALPAELPTARWERHRDALAGSHLSFDEWTTLDATFTRFAQIEATRAQGNAAGDRAGALHHAQRHEFADTYELALESNGVVTHRGIGWRERSWRKLRLRNEQRTARDDAVQMLERMRAKSASG